MKVLIFDTETTGKANFGKPSVDPVQPKLVQLGAMLVDLESGREYQTADLIVYPSSWEIPQEAALIHGITQQTAKDVGVNLDTAVNIFLDMMISADLVVAHNIAFDQLIMERACAMVDLAMGREVENPFAGKTMFCTMKAATPIVKKRSKRPQSNEDYKWPKLVECMEFFFKEGLDGAHNAIVDCKACHRILVEMINRGDITL
jgi:DNA polymerase-3 subunit epsilon